MPITIEQLNAADAAEAAQPAGRPLRTLALDREAALAHRPFRSLGHLKQAMADIVREAGATSSSR
jgi:N-carbamoyl-L-amino-acid hydrolase